VHKKDKNVLISVRLVQQCERRKGRQWIWLKKLLIQLQKQQQKQSRKKKKSPVASDDDELTSAPRKKRRGDSTKAESTSSSDDDDEKLEQETLESVTTNLGKSKHKTKEMQDADMETNVGPWDFMLNDGHRGNATQVQRSIVPWCISIYGLNYHKNVTLDVIKEMVLALCAMNG
jgi:hypothetical protein